MPHHLFEVMGHFSIYWFFLTQSVSASSIAARRLRFFFFAILRKSVEMLFLICAPIATRGSLASFCSFFSASSSARASSSSFCRSSAVLLIFKIIPHKKHYCPAILKKI